MMPQRLRGGLPPTFGVGTAGHESARVPSTFAALYDDLSDVALSNGGATVES